METKWKRNGNEMETEWKQTRLFPFRFHFVSIFLHLKIIQIEPYINSMIYSFLTERLEAYLKLFMFVLFLHHLLLWSNRRYKFEFFIS